jgi:hypothetical protein
MIITEEMRDQVCKYTDAGTWKASWHWDRDKNGSVTIKGARQMLRDLGCGGCEGDEILDAVYDIRQRYKLAEELRAAIEAEEKDIQDESVMLTKEN